MKWPIGEHFVAHPDGTFQCEECADRDGVDWEDDDTDVWEVGSEGWLGPVVCRTCKLSIPVYVDGNESEETEISTCGRCGRTYEGESCVCEEERTCDRCRLPRRMAPGQTECVPCALAPFKET